MARGINKGALFQDDPDRTKFRERLETCIVETKRSVYAWAFMDNHVHLLVKSGAKPVATLMRKLLTWYAVYYNRRHHRSGHFFENRCKSVLCQEDQYSLTLVRSIHLNPVRAGLVIHPRELDTYPWSGHTALAGKEHHA